MNKKIGILTFEKFHGKANIGSSMIRGKWVIDAWNDKNVEEYKIGQKYDVVIYQKVYWLEHAKQFNGIKILDLCDPDWLHWATRTKQMINQCNAVTCGTEKIANYIRKITDKPVIVVPDRIKLDVFPETKEHTDKERLTAVWYGYSQNFEALESTIPVLMERGIDLIVISNKSYIAPRHIQKKIKITNYPWSADSWKRDILRGDFVLNPRPMGGKWDYKSNNKTIISWALKMPVAHTDKELDLMMKAQDRKDISNARYEDVKIDWGIEKSVEDYKSLINIL